MTHPIDLPLDVMDGMLRDVLFIIRVERGEGGEKTTLSEHIRNRRANPMPVWWVMP